MTPASQNPGKLRAVRVWDVPVRLFHWLLAAAFATAFLTRGDARYLDVHVFAGYLFGGLILFRLVWGFAGTRFARFGDFIHGWPEVRAYLQTLRQGRVRHYLGHNPAGGWAILTMLVVGAGVAVTGLITLGGEEGHGPLGGLLSVATGVRAHEIHELLSWAMLAVVAVHVAGVAVESLLQRTNLVGAMFTGAKWVAGGIAGVPAHRLTGFVIGLGALWLGVWTFQGYWFDTPEDPYRPFVAAALPSSELWNQECSDCHLPYHPALLPRRSWEVMLEQQADHFGEDLYLEQETVAALLDFSRRYAAEAQLNEAAFYVAATTPRGEAPQRITETLYWKREHRRVPERYWQAKDAIAGRFDCGACHLDAKEGTFQDGAMRLPDLSLNDQPLMANVWRSVYSKVR